MTYQLNFHGYDVLKMNFERLVQNVSKAPGAQIELTPELTHRIIENGNGRYSLELGARVQQEDFPIRVEIVIRGKFEIKEAEDPLRVMEINATAIMFPYLRSLFGMLTAIAGISPITLPVINVVELFRQKSEPKTES